MPSVGESGFLRFDRCETFGSVVWVQKEHCGIEFDELLDIALVTAMRHLSESTRSDDAYLNAQAVRDWVIGQGRLPPGR